MNKRKPKVRPIRIGDLKTDILWGTGKKLKLDKRCILVGAPDAWLSIEQTKKLIKFLNEAIRDLQKRQRIRE